MEGESSISEVEDSGLQICLHEEGTPASIEQLSVGTAYEIGYTTSLSSVDGFALFVVDTSPAQIEATISPTGGGDWSNGESFTFDRVTALVGHEVAAPGYPDGLFRSYMATNEFGATPAAGQGSLCSIVADTPGTLRLHLYLWRIEAGGSEGQDIEARIEVSIFEP